MKDFINEMADLIVISLNRQLTPDEQARLNEWLDKDEANKILYAQLSSEKYVEEELGKIASYKNEAMLASIMEKMPATEPAAPRIISRGLRYGVAASILVVIGLGIFYLQRSEKPARNLGQTAPVSNDAQPGANTAILILSDGSSIVLDSTAEGLLAKQGSAEIINAGQLLSYRKGNAAVGNETLYNTVTTPRGGQYQLVLPDGTKVWLNAASSLKFPVVFSGNKRAVELKGEAYFEVAADSKSPFEVWAGLAKVDVLGTSFNIMDYPEENGATTTLISGKVKVNYNNSSKILTAGQQAVAGKNQTLLLASEPNIEKVIAWKNGDFQFEKDDLKTIMRQIGRWYNVEVIYEQYTSGRVFSGIMSRNKKLSDVLSVLQQSNIQYRIEGQKIYIKS